MLSSPVTRPTPSTRSSPLLTTKPMSPTVSWIFRGGTFFFFLVGAAPTWVSVSASTAIATRAPRAQRRLESVRRMNLTPCAAVGENPRTRLENPAASFAKSSPAHFPVRRTAVESRSPDGGRNLAILARQGQGRFLTQLGKLRKNRSRPIGNPLNYRPSAVQSEISWIPPQGAGKTQAGFDIESQLRKPRRSGQSCAEMPYGTGAHQFCGIPDVALRPSESGPSRSRTVLLAGCISPCIGL